MASTGAITIPMMKDGGYHKETAGAIEAAASTGGQLMPPIMGAAAFLLAENLQANYIDVMKAALIPSILYYISLFMFADLEAGRRKIDRVPEHMIPNLSAVSQSTVYYLTHSAQEAGLIAENGGHQKAV